jgi:hypothetical protein
MRPLFHGSLTPLLQSVHNPPFKLPFVSCDRLPVSAPFLPKWAHAVRSKLHKKLP